MEWLLSSELSSISPNMEYGVQLLSFPVDAKELVQSIPIPFERIPPEDGPPASILQWYARLGSHLLLMQIEEKYINTNSTLIAIYTPYLHPVGVIPEWEILTHLDKLPTSIQFDCPVFIGDRHLVHSHHVTKLDNQGITTTVYKGCSFKDADGLISYIKRDTNNNYSYAIAIPEDESCWSIVEYDSLKSKIHGAYPDKSLAIRAAISISNYLGDNIILYIQDLNFLPAKTECRISCGKIV